LLEFIKKGQTSIQVINTDLMNYLPLRRQWKNAGLNIKDCTCQLCQKKGNCPFVYDINSVNGDCIIEKIKEDGQE